MNIIRRTWGFKSPESPDVTRDPRSQSNSVRNAVEDAARALPADEPRAHVFYEDRVDVRMVLASSARREVVETRTHGGVIAGRTSTHHTEPAFLRTTGTGPGRIPYPKTSPKCLHGNWVAELEADILDAGNQAAAGRRHPFWSAKLVSFHQEIWVGSPGRKIGHDIRRGCRLELRVQSGEPSSAHAAADLVLRQSDRPPPLREAFERAFQRAEERPFPLSPPRTGPTAAVFAPGAAGIVAHELIGHALEGDVVAHGRSWLRAGARLPALRHVSVIDDPRRGRGAWALDDEGTAAREVVLIERNHVAGSLLDRTAAAALGSASTGHARRSSYLDDVRPRMGCTFIDAGDDDPTEIIRSTHEGLFIRRLIAGHTDPRRGRAVFVASDADRIEDGRLAGPVDSFVFEIDGPEAWPSIDRVGHDLAFDTCVGSCVRDGQPLAVSVGAPTIRIGVVRVRS